MGYISKVAIMLSYNLNKKIINEISEMEEGEIKRELENLFNYYKDIAVENPSTGNILYYWDRIKWYFCCDGLYTEIIWIHRRLRSSPSKEYRYILVGEDNGIWVKGSLTDDRLELRTVTNIEFNKTGFIQRIKRKIV